MKFNSDIDIDYGDRSAILQHIEHTTAAVRDGEKLRKHNTGVYVTAVPYDPATNLCSIPYTAAERRGYVKLDLLNVHVYKSVRDEAHLQQLMREPQWNMLRDRSFTEQLIHIGNHYDSMCAMPEPVDSIPRMAMFLSVIRPGKKHLIGLPWSEVSKTVWQASDDGYSFKRSHAVAYAHLVVVHMNLLCEGSRASDEQA